MMRSWGLSRAVYAAKLAGLQRKPLIRAGQCPTSILEGKVHMLNMTVAGPQMWQRQERAGNSQNKCSQHL